MRIILVVVICLLTLVPISQAVTPFTPVLISTPVCGVPHSGELVRCSPIVVGSDCLNEVIVSVNGVMGPDFGQTITVWAAIFNPYPSSADNIILIQDTAERLYFSARHHPIVFTFPGTPTQTVSAIGAIMKDAPPGTYVSAVSVSCPNHIP